jgi:putative acetyltransferase
MITTPIAPIAQQDFIRILEIWEASIRATHHFLKETDIEFFKPLIYNQYLGELTLIGIPGPSGELAGFLGMADDKIEMLFIHPDNFGQGLGRLLVDHAVAYLGARKVDVNEQNPGAYAFYQKLGFRLVKRSPLDATGNPFPILHLEKYLPNGFLP